MKEVEKRARQGFKSPLVHQKKTDTVYNVHHGVSIWSGPRA